MPEQVTPFRASDPTRVYHVFRNCPEAKKILEHNERTGEGEKELCGVCAWGLTFSQQRAQ